MTPLAIAGSLSGVAMIVWCAPRLENLRLAYWVARLGRRSIVVYTAHYPVLFWMSPIVGAWGLGAVPTYLIIVGTSLATVAALLIVRPWVPILFELTWPGRMRTA